MAGLVHDVYCRHRDKCDDTGFSHRGECGGCLGRCEPCNEAGNNCGQWQDCACSPSACGDGHICKRYIDIEFTLESFTCQGEMCCIESSPIVRSCTQNGLLDDNGVYAFEPIVGHPSGWSDCTGTVPAIKYPTTTHRIRLTRTACGCFWGGYWSSSCDMNKCCVEAGVGNHICGDGDCDDPLVCTHCDPESDPCALIDDGWASSLDDWGDGGGSEQGGTTEEALCTSLPCGTTPCDYTGGSCTLLGGQGNCKKCGTFKPFHIEAFLQHNEGSNCEGEWQLEIRGQTTMIRSHASGEGTSSICDFGSAASPPSPNPFASGTQWALFRGRWNGFAGCGGYWSSNQGVDCHYASYDQCHIDDLYHVGCSCPPTVEFDSSVLVDNNLASIHPTHIVTDGCTWRECYTTNAACDNLSSDCIGSTCYGEVKNWCAYCEWCPECVDNEGGSCLPINGGAACQLPTDSQYSKYSYQNPCEPERCTAGTIADDCWDCVDGVSRLCTDCNIKMTPNNNEKPFWVE